jgi:hypothetical protein
MLGLRIMSGRDITGRFGKGQTENLTAMKAPNKIFRCSAAKGAGWIWWLVILAVPNLVNAQAGFTYSTNNGPITITGYTGSQTVVSVPSTINGLPVATIGDYAFYAHTNVSSVTIPNSVSRIGMWAFLSCIRLTNFSMGSSITNIGDGAFTGCTSLGSIRIDAGVTHIGDSVFYYCGSLTNIMVDPLNAFYSSLDGVLFDKNRVTLIQFPGGKTGSYTMPNSVTQISEIAFRYATNVTRIEISEGVTSIGTATFEGCSGLVNVTIPEGVGNIGDYAFRDSTRLVQVTIPSQVSRIGSGAFQGCIGLTNLTIGSSVTNIAELAFANCESLTSVAIPDSVVSIGNWACYFCVDLRDLTIGRSVTAIGDSAFSHSQSLASVVLPESVTSIGRNALDSCFTLSGLYFQGDAPGLGQNAFVSANNVTVYRLPGTSGWTSTFGGRPTAWWHLPGPVILDFGPSFGVRTNRFGFIASWATNAAVALEACTNLANPAWASLTTNSLVNGWIYFSDPDWANYPGRVYRVRSR